MHAVIAASAPAVAAKARQAGSEAAVEQAEPEAPPKAS